MPNPFKSETSTKPVVVPQTTNGTYGAIAIPTFEPGWFAKLQQNRAASRASTQIMLKRVEAVRDVQVAEIDVIRSEAISAAVTAARLRGVNTRAAIVAEHASSMGALQTALVTTSQSIATELSGARYAGAHHNLVVHNQRREEIAKRLQAGQIDDHEALKMLELIEALHQQCEEMTDLSYEGGRKVALKAFKLATDTADEISRQIFNSEGA